MTGCCCCRGFWKLLCCDVWQNVVFDASWCPKQGRRCCEYKPLTCWVYIVSSNIFFKQTRNFYTILQCVPLKVEPATTAFRSSSERTAGKGVSHNPERSRRMLVSGFRVTWDVLYNARYFAEIFIRCCLRFSLKIFWGLIYILLYFKKEDN
jgi:hypothetical protein